ncbi:predicted nucleic acid-binding protein, containing PIN domain [Thermococcus kodakarensis KOD1]|uniref:Predicted nucleic acid-binding protein, containing PIN domain n=1 Tax=Thermococcus kodakarensis (strain ATCC BAA-918 / JCM 12380 / KOD1) TaxID=69014 RepID=Q5JDL4_THEKO|nr:PIN domain-containing protein [Thermococcus kodakarensis]WCN27831.1 nucleotide-binding protein [Thermococcus kodakarensis]WCN30129.1 nucleotide-binding protein [Thermococcus kodakarensis]BAD86134.1 predicted nucleic acid-binding protein, containing PIN domain [Thermococcus kodakarensis KOD1]
MSESRRREWLVVPDTNFLLVPGQFGVDIISELHRILDVKFRVVVPNVVLDELNVIERKSRGRDLMAVRMAKKLAERFETVEIGRFGERPIDDQIFDFAVRNERVIVCTNDKGLKKRLREKGVPVVYLRSKKILELEGMLE